MNAQAIINSDRAMAIMLTGALEVIAETNGRTFEETAEAFKMKVPAVYNQAAEMCALAIKKLQEVV